MALALEGLLHVLPMSVLLFLLELYHFLLFLYLVKEAIWRCSVKFFQLQDVGCSSDRLALVWQVGLLYFLGWHPDEFVMSGWSLARPWCSIALFTLLALVVYRARRLPQTLPRVIPPRDAVLL